MLIFIVLSIILCGLLYVAKSRRGVNMIAGVFYTFQLIQALALLSFRTQIETVSFFKFDSLGILFFSLMSVITAISFYQSTLYLDKESLREYRFYNVAMILLCVSVSGVYFAHNIALTWVFLEATTLCAAALIYHRRTTRSLEATWKYVFVCSTGIAVAYLGILMLSTAATDGDLSYTSLAMAVQSADPLYLKIAFLFILVGYSCKMEVFPLYSIGVDANFAAPTPASAVISTVLVNAGFLAVFRVYKVIMLSSVAHWASAVMIIAGLISVLVGAVYIRRTNNYKRFLAYSTVENMGIVLIGLGVGGVGVYAALLHVIAHTFIKSALFFNIAQVGRIYGTYRINRVGNYMKINRLGALSVIVGSVVLLGFPPSAIFISEINIFKQIIAQQQWWVLIVLVPLLCFVIYSFMYRILTLCFREIGASTRDLYKSSRVMGYVAVALIVIAILLGLFQCSFLQEFVGISLGII